MKSVFFPLLVFVANLVGFSHFALAEYVQPLAPASWELLGGANANIGGENYAATPGDPASSDVFFGVSSLRK